MLKMAVEKQNKDPEPSSLSFKFLSKKKNNKLVERSSKFKKLDSETFEDDNDKDYIVSAEGQELQSVKPKKVISEIIIPLITKNKWRVEGDDLEKEAAEEILKELREENNSSVEVGPILMQNRPPIPRNGEEINEMYDISVRPEPSTLEDYDSIPITVFGTAMLKGMGWSVGKPIGLNNTGLVEPIEYIPRHKGLGLGAEKMNETNKSIRKRKLGEDDIKKKDYTPIIEKDGRVRHIKGLSEEVKDNSIGYFPGCYVYIQNGPHKDLSGKIISVDEDTTRISVQLRISQEVIQISQYNAELIDLETYKLSSNKCSNKTTSKPNNNINPVSRDKETDEPCWLVPNIRVRIISQKYKNGKFYNKKVKVLDVISKNVCTCKTDDKTHLEDVHQKYLETVIPREKDSYVMIVLGKYKGRLAKLLERSSKDCNAVVQMTSNKHVIKISYDHVSEYLGELPDDEFL
ncbi:G-patch domain and KOW motifs-containing protein isoform X1 [Hydra vulgaris]|nr:G-patch domain and KOW motifs-containing protein [Hydra vulgaris]